MYWTNFSNNPSINEIMEELLRGLASEIRDRVLEDNHTEPEYMHLAYQDRCNRLIKYLVKKACNDDGWDQY